MSRRSLRLSASACSLCEDGHGDGSRGTFQTSVEAPGMTRKRRTMASQAAPARPSPHRTPSTVSLLSKASFSSTILQESTIQDQTTISHFWGLDDDRDLKGGHTTMNQASGDAAAAESQSALSNAYSGRDCSMLSERKEVLTAFSAAHMPPTRVYSRARSQKHKSGSLTFYMTTILEAAKYSATSVTSLLVQLFHVVLLKLGFASKAYSNCYGGTNVKEILREDHQLGTNGEYLCDDCKGKKELELRPAAYMHSSPSRGGARTIWHIFSYAGYFLLHALQRTGTAGWLASKKVLSLLRLAVVSPGAGILCFLGAILYNLVALPALLLCRLLQIRGLQKLVKIIAFLPPLILVGMMCWGPAGLSLVPAFTGLIVPKTNQWDNSAQILTLPVDLLDDVEPLPDNGPLKSDSRLSHLEDKVAALTEKWRHLDDQYRKILLSLETFQSQLTRLSEKTETVIQLKSMVQQYLKDQEPMDYEQRILTLEQLLVQLTEKLDWPASQFTTKTDVQILLRDLERRIIRRLWYYLRELNIRPSPELVRNIMTQSEIPSISETQVRTIVNNALKLYSEDKTGMADFALESAGGSVVSTRCSENYETKTAVISPFGLPLWYFSQSPRAVIQPDMYPGNCWAFKGSQGHLVIQLSRKIHPTAFTMEHISKSLMPDGNIDSAPKDFAVYGLEDEHQEEGILLGQYRYDPDGNALQTFQATEPVDKVYQMVELKILSNWGHADYTCLYRFRVHGKVAQ